MEPAGLAATGLIVLGVITPGPNNLVVLREAARSGWRGVAPAIAGIVAGGTVLLALASFGVGAVVATQPRATAAITAVGCLYLTLLGVRFATSRPRGAAEPPSEELPAGGWGLFVFQFLNPKAWLLFLTVSAAVSTDLGTRAALVPLLAVFVLVSAASLALWSWAGITLQRLFAVPAARTWLDRGTGVLLIACALLLLVQTWR